MKILIELDPEIEDLTVTIRCPEMTDEAERIQKAVMAMASASDTGQLVFYQGEKEFYFPAKQILFFETEGEKINAHTGKDVFQVKHRLYELESMLPAYFLRVSKSTILNTREVYSITKNLTASSEVEFRNTHKKVYVSRNYYKPLKNILDERVRRLER